MSEKRSVTRTIARRYQAADKKGKQKILDEFTRTAGYNRKYAISELGTEGGNETTLVRH